MTPEYQIIVTLCAVAAFICLALGLALATRAPSPPPAPVKVDPARCKHDDAYHRGKGEPCGRCGWALMKIPDCDHDWVVRSGTPEIGQISECSKCQCQSLKIAVGDLAPGESVAIPLIIRARDDQ